ncbi:whey acidic protein-like isoform X3 [Coturnix japonica]|uniref:whey acidic protein-like isoform X3 n=1 Tax=Coturnix japonica TaxID=93934 RepID=UPI0013A5F224|nr:whey acidic protein-like isoform X3 [Coturnix japonica]
MEGCSVGSGNVTLLMCAGLCPHGTTALHSTPCPAGKDGFCPANAGLFPSYDCREWCRCDADCPGEEKCCLQGCDYVCLRPDQEKPGICPLSEQAEESRCQELCAGDGQCPGDEKCCSSRCGHVCMAPEPDKPGQCPKVRPQLTSEPCTEDDDDCLHDRDCPRQEKCCFSGCAMRCSRPARGVGRRLGPSCTTGKEQQHQHCRQCRGPCTQPRPLLPQSIPGGAPGQSRAGTPGTDIGTSAWMTACAGGMRSAATQAALGPAWLYLLWPRIHPFPCP